MLESLELALTLHLLALCFKSSIFINFPCDVVMNRDSVTDASLHHSQTVVEDLWPPDPPL